MNNYPESFRCFGKGEIGKKKTWCKHVIAWIAQLVPNLLNWQLAGKLVTGR